jgi:hypothetical protein
VLLFPASLPTFVVVVYEQHLKYDRLSRVSEHQYTFKMSEARGIAYEILNLDKRAKQMFPMQS